MNSLRPTLTGYFKDPLTRAVKIPSGKTLLRISDPKDIYLSIIKSKQLISLNLSLGLLCKLGYTTYFFQ